MSTMNAQNRSLEVWYGKIKRGEIKLPRFQRFEAWDTNRISSLINTITQNLPLGITLVLDVGDKEQFISRYIESAPSSSGRVFELLLDGQQRLTAFWKVLHNEYEFDTFYIYIPEFDTRQDKENNTQAVYSKSRYRNKNNQMYPLWCDNPQECLKRGMIPAYLLKPEDIQKEIDEWVNQATSNNKPNDPNKFESFFQHLHAIKNKIHDLRSVIRNYNLPHLSLPSNTTKDIALEVFINMNTNSKPLSTYDIIVAEIEGIKGQSLHELQNDLNNKSPEIKNYYDLSYLILNTSALLQEKLPNQKGLWEMDKGQLVDNWKKMELGLDEMARFLASEGIIDKKRLPTNAVLAVIAALYPFIAKSGDKRGADELLLKKYLWSAFFTDRYENSAATHAYYDYIALKRVILSYKKENNDLYNERDVPIFNTENYQVASADELLRAGWPSKETIRGKAIVAVACRLGSHDFATSVRINKDNILNRHYHHVFPDALLKEANIESFLALNCALIEDQTNWNIGRKEPLQYLKERYKWASEAVVNERLNSHLIPIKELSNGGYEGCATDEVRKAKIKQDFGNFIRKRAALFSKAANLLCAGHNITSSEVVNM